MSGPIKTFFVEPTGQFVATYHDDSTRIFDSEEAARGTNWNILSPAYKLPDGKLVRGGDLPPGAIYLNDGEHWRKGPDGLSITVVCPDGWHWSPDSRASNCTRKDDEIHRCWVRHGDPKLGNLHVDKVGNTCAAGAGSILTGRTPCWHGFLHNGHLVTC